MSNMCNVINLDAAVPGGLCATDTDYIVCVQVVSRMIWAVPVVGVSADVSPLGFCAGCKLKPSDVDVMIPLGACIIILKRLMPSTAFVCAIRRCVQI